MPGGPAPMYPLRTPQPLCGAPPGGVSPPARTPGRFLMTVSRETEEEIRRLYYGEHFKVHTICAAVDVHHDVVERVLGLQTRHKPPPRPTTMDSYKEFVTEQLGLYTGLRATRLYDSS